MLFYALYIFFIINTKNGYYRITYIFIMYEYECQYYIQENMDPKTETRIFFNGVGGQIL